MTAEMRESTLGIIGLGYVGLPLAVEAARAGIRVLGFDIKDDVVAGINAGRSHIQDLRDQEIAELVDGGMLSATVEMARLAECDVISICVPTPLAKTGDPDISYVSAATEAVAGALRPGQLIVLESTTYPGTTREVLLPALEGRDVELGDGTRRRLRVGEDFFLCFSPERVDPGNQVWTTRNTPKVIGGITQGCAREGEAFYSRFIDTVVPVSSPEAAELTKLLENTFRSVNIGLVNEIALMAERLGVDVWEVIDAAATKPFGFMKFTPGPGLGGHCIPIDPLYLSWKMKTLNYKTRFIDLASEINADMPRFVVDKVREALNRVRKSVNGSRVLILGVAYKPNIDDLRESPALDILHLLDEEGAQVLYHDPFVERFHEAGREWASQALSDELLAGVDVAVIVTDHRGIDYGRIMEKAPIVIDTRNATRDLPRAPAPGPLGSWIVKEEPAP